MRDGALFQTSVISQNTETLFHEARLSGRITGSSDSGRSDAVLDLKGRYHHFRLHQGMGPKLRVRVDPGRGLPERFFEFVALLFGRSMSRLLVLPTVCRLTRGCTGLLKNRMGFWVLAYLDDFLIFPSQSSSTTTTDCRLTARLIDGLLKQ
jgi:hypothetical protein